MIVVSYSPYSDMALRKAWFWHRWQPPIKENVAFIPSAYLSCENRIITRCYCYRLLGVELSIVLADEEGK